MAFNNSINHDAMSKDGLNITKINVNPEGKQPQMCLTFFELNNILQSMIFLFDHLQYSNEPKGMR